MKLTAPCLVPILVITYVLIPLWRQKSHLFYKWGNLVIGNIVLHHSLLGNNSSNYLCNDLTFEKEKSPLLWKGKLSDCQHGLIKELISKWSLSPTFKVWSKNWGWYPCCANFENIDCIPSLVMWCQTGFSITDLDSANRSSANWKKLERERGCHLQNPFPLILTNMNLTHYTTGHITQIKQQRQG